MVAQEIRKGLGGDFSAAVNGDIGQGRGGAGDDIFPFPLLRI